MTNTTVASPKIIAAGQIVTINAGDVLTIGRVPPPPVIIDSGSNTITPGTTTTWGNTTDGVTLNTPASVAPGATLVLDIVDFDQLKGAGQKITVQPGGSIQLGDKVKTVLPDTLYKIKTRE